MFDEHVFNFIKTDEGFVVDVFDPKGNIILAHIRVNAVLWSASSSLKLYEAITDDYDDLCLFLTGIYFEYGKVAKHKTVQEAYGILTGLFESYNITCVEKRE